MIPNDPPQNPGPAETAPPSVEPTDAPQYDLSATASPVPAAEAASPAGTTITSPESTPPANPPAESSLPAEPTGIVSLQGEHTRPAAGPPDVGPQSHQPFPPSETVPESEAPSTPSVGNPSKFPPGYATPTPVEPYPALVPTGPGRNVRLALSVIVPNVLALLLLFITSLIMQRGNGINGPDRSGEYIMAEFVIIPLVMGLCAAFCLRGTGTGIGVNIIISVINTGIAIALSYLVVHEGVICLVIVSPLLVSFIMVGGLIGRLIFRPRYRKLQMSLVPMLAVALVADARSPHNFQTAVTDEVTIHASPERVWNYVVDVPPIQEKSGNWLCRIGLPAPVQATTTGHFVGAERRCIFEHNLVFGEKIAELEPGKKLTFDIVSQPADPEIMGHLELQRGQMILRDNRDGTTTLIGTSWYRLKVYPAEYYDLWASRMTRDVHLRVMRHIKQLAEGSF